MTRRPHPLTLVAVVLVLVAAVGSTSYAAGLARGSVGTPQLKDGAVTTAKVRVGAVTGRKVKDRSIGSSDLAAGVVPRTIAVRRTVAPGASAVLARSGGLSFEGFCNTSGAQGTSGTLRVAPTAERTPLNPVNGTFV